MMNLSSFEYQEILRNWLSSDNLKVETGLEAQSAFKKKALLLNAAFFWNKTILKVNTDYPEGVLSYIMLVGEDRCY